MGRSPRDRAWRAAYGVEDLDGHRWLFSQHARDVDPQEWGATLKH